MSNSFAVNKSFYNRSGYVEVEMNDGTLAKYGSENGIDFKFSGEKYGDIFSFFNVSILGLSNKTINELAVWHPVESYSRARKIKVYAGYKQSGTPLIFEGFIAEAKPTSPPERWINFRCLRFSSVDEIVNTFSARGSIESVFQKVAQAMGLGYYWSPRFNSSFSKKNISFSISAPCRKLQLCEEFANTYNIYVYEENGILKATPSKYWLVNIGGETAVQVDKITGMLSVCDVEVKGATILKRLDDSIPLMGNINLYTELLPKANGLYSVICKTHRGHLRGEEWVTELKCIRKGAPV